MNNRLTNSNAAFAILSATLSVADMVGRIAPTPDRTVEKGSPVRGTGGNSHRYSVLAFDSHIERQAEPEAHIDDLLLRLHAAQDAIRGLVEEGLVEEPQSVPARLSLYVRTAESVVGLDISSAQLRAIGEFGAHLGVEVDTDCEDLIE
jgi:hypothetical protein